jgi:hypothetical protein
MSLGLRREMTVTSHESRAKAVGAGNVGGPTYRRWLATDCLRLNHRDSDEGSCARWWTACLGWAGGTRARARARPGSRGKKSSIARRLCYLRYKVLAAVYRYSSHWTNRALVAAEEQDCLKPGRCRYPGDWIVLTRMNGLGASSRGVEEEQLTSQDLGSRFTPCQGREKVCRILECSSCDKPNAVTVGWESKCAPGETERDSAGSTSWCMYTVPTVCSMYYTQCVYGERMYALARVCSKYGVCIC